ncbi:MAG: DUF2905 domain-containing protein [Desulfovermiculus sp.]
MSRLLIIAGLLLIGLGALLHFAPWTLTWFGKLPGDIRIQSERTKVFIPITSMIVISILISVLINIFRR